MAAEMDQASASGAGGQARTPQADQGVAPFGRSQTDDDGVLTYLYYIVGAIGACWGLTEIFLVTNPFLAVYFKYAWIIGLGVWAIALGAALGARRWTGVVAVLLAAAAAAASLSTAFPDDASGVNVGQAMSWISGPALSFDLQAGWTGYLGMFALALAAATLVCRLFRHWMVRHVSRR